MTAVTGLHVETAAMALPYRGLNVITLVRTAHDTSL